eukprot:scaffold33997_cov118-Isochrysis_galbana.AAC.1
MDDPVILKKRRGEEGAPSQAMHLDAMNTKPVWSAAARPAPLTVPDRQLHARPQEDGFHRFGPIRQTEPRQGLGGEHCEPRVPGVKPVGSLQQRAGQQGTLVHRAARLPGSAESGAVGRRRRPVAGATEPGIAGWHEVTPPQSGARVGAMWEQMLGEPRTEIARLLSSSAAMPGFGPSGPASRFTVLK